MLIPLQYLVDKYRPNFKGVIHVGAHYGEEVPEYINQNIKLIILFEPCKEAYEILCNYVAPLNNIVTFQYALGATAGVVKMNTASFNKGESNSILKPKLHLQQHPEVVFDGEEKVLMMKLDDLLDGYPLINFIVMDCQGYEGEVIKGGKQYLKNVDYIYLEVNKGETYEGNMLIDEVDELLSDFQRVETKWAGNTTWGDAFYIRKILIK